jgi:hypothetical protein
MESVLWDITGRNHIIGAVGVENCVFENCTFTNVGFAGDRTFIDKFRHGVHG